MVENGSRFHFPQAESEFTPLGIRHIEIEGVDQTPTTLTLEEFCQSLPTASRLAHSFGSWRVARLIARQLEYQFVDPKHSPSPRSKFDRMCKRISQFACLTTAFNYVTSEQHEQPYCNPLPYSVALVLVSQLAYKVTEKRPLPPEVLKIVNDAPEGVNVQTPVTRSKINARAFIGIDRRSIYRDSSIPPTQIREILKSGLVTLVGANLLFMFGTPWTSSFVLRSTELNTGNGRKELKYTIPGGHTMNTEGLTVALRSAEFLRDMNIGRDRSGHLLLDIPFLREALEETGLPLDAFATTRPLTRADQIVRKRTDGTPVRYLAYIGQTPIWPHTKSLLTNGDGLGEWNVFGIGGIDVARRDIASTFNVTPIAEIALRVYRE
ncbi:hypothetical protein ACFLY9_02115 [Patescibacteria group bacterium]